MDEATLSLKRQMDDAAEIAAEELESIKAGMSPEALKAVQQIGMWMKANYIKAGYKRLSKILIVHM
jgi:hypothetical protein